MSQYHPIRRQLLQESDLTGSRRNCHLIVLAHVFFDELRDHFLCGFQTRKVHVKVVKVEKDYAPAVEWNWTFQIDRRGTASSCELALLVAAGGDLFKGLNRARFAVNAQLEIVSSQAVDKLSLFVKNHHIRLDE